MERRTSTVSLEIRASADEPAATMIVGYAAMFNQMSDDLGGFREVIAPGAFTKALDDDVRALFNHDANIVLGRTRSKTLRISQDEKGLAIEIDPPATAAAAALMESIRRGDISQMSFGFQTIKDKWEMNSSGEPLRTLLEVRLFDVSPVTYPAYSQTEVTLRSLAEFRKTVCAENISPQHMGAIARMKMLTSQAGI